MGVEDFTSAGRKSDALNLALSVRVEEAELDLSRIRREDCDVDAATIERNAKRFGKAFGNAKSHFPRLRR